MSGHSKWATIKRAKGAADAKRGAAFTRLTREITIAAKEGGGNPDSNFRLRLAMDKARSANMPKDNIERAINRGTGAGEDAASYEELMYEGYLPLKVPAMIKVTTDNRNRTVAEVRKFITKAGGSLGEAGSVGWQFNRKGYIAILREGKVDPDEVFMVAADAGADDVQTSDEAVEVYCEVEHLRAVREALVKAGYALESAEISMIPTTQTQLKNQEEVDRVLQVIEELEEMDDVDQVYHNLEVPA